jgi:hypothetical protein
MGLHYPLAALFAWGIFLTLVRFWAAREAAHFPAEEQLSDAALEDDSPPLGESVLIPEDCWRRKSSRGWGWLDWLDFWRRIQPPSSRRCGREKERAD